MSISSSQNATIANVLKLGHAEVSEVQITVKGCFPGLKREKPVFHLRYIICQGVQKFSVRLLKKKTKKTYTL